MASSSSSISIESSIRLKGKANAINLYSPLDASTWQFRVLRLLPGILGSVIKCEIQLHTIYAPPKYVALSYCWGDEEERRPAIVDEVEITITANLEEALQQIRAIDIELIWVDALCINQNDVQERSLQVRFMKQIYSKADSTYAWVGNVLWDDASQGLQYLQRVASGALSISTHPPRKPSGASRLVRSFRRTARLAGQNYDRSDDNTSSDHLLESLTDEPAFEALQDLFNRPYWQRRWIIQEAAVAKTTHIMCGNTVLGLEDFAQAVDKCMGDWRWSPPYDTSYRFIRRILRIRGSCLDHEPPPLIQAIFETRDSLSKDERDKVFALVGVSKDGDNLVPTPNYEESLAALNVNLTKQILRRNARFDLIHFYQRGGPLSTAMPSWCPDWLSSELPARAFRLAQEGVRLTLAEAARMCRDEGPKLYLEGVELGSVVAMTSILEDEDPTSTSQAIPQPDLSRADIPRYYGRAGTEVVATCLCAGEGSTNMHRSSMSSMLSELHWLTLLAASKGQIWDLQPIWPGLRKWLSCNKEFMLYKNRSLDTLGHVRFGFGALQIVRFLILMDPYSICGLLFAAFVTVVAVGIGLTLLILIVMYFVHPAIGLPLGFACLALCLFLLFFEVLVQLRLSDVRHAIKDTIQKPLFEKARLVRLETGALALATSDTQVGDKICLIAGCSIPIVLRHSDLSGGDGLWYNVGKACVCLSHKDSRRYRGLTGVFLSHKETIKGAEVDDAYQYNTLIQQYKTYEEWKTFIVV